MPMDIVIPVSEIQRFAKECLKAVGTLDDIAQAQASLMVEADQRGFFSHGITKLQMYLHDINAGLCDPKAKPVLIKESDSTAWVNGNNSLGAYTGIFCMEKAIEKAKKSGVGWVSLKNANHNGIESFYTLIALKQGMIGFAFSNTSPVVVPTRGTTSALGTNPLCMAAPAKDEDHFLLDMSTSATSLEKIELYQNNSWTLPLGWAVDESEHPITDACQAMKYSKLMPLGGLEENSGYKGTGLSMLVEILCGICSGSDYAHHIKRQSIRDGPSNLGQCYIAVNPKTFAPGFEDRMSDMVDYIRNMTPAEEDKPVMVPGDRERNTMENVKKNGGIQYFNFHFDMFTKLASTYGIEPMKDKNGCIVDSNWTGGYLCDSKCAKTLCSK